MKKAILLMLLILTCSIIVEQYFYYQADKLIYTELNIPGNLTHQNFGEHNDSHEYIVTNDLNLNLNIQLLSENIIHPFNLHPQKSLNYIWQPPEMI